MSIKVIKPGLLSSVQDLGRIGFQKYGINVAGAMDVVSLRLANILTGNQEGEAGLEITMTGPTLEFMSDTLIALTGADLSPVIDGMPVRMHRAVAVKAGSILKFGTCLKGCRTYLAVAGGFDVPAVMASKSTYLRGALGGFQGRALQKGDVLYSGTPSERAKHCLLALLARGARSFRIADWFLSPPHLLEPEFHKPLRVLPGLQQHAYKKAAIKAFFTESFNLTTSSDRLGFRLQGPAIALTAPLEMISEIATFGSVQVPPDGNPIVLMADHQSVAGYPKIAQVISADLPRLAQYRPGMQVRFSQIEIAAAEELYFARERYIENTKIAVTSKF
ncbi:MAG TPA: biotin-dependent carboxyltransferase family protein [Candidatus Avacidaminococcus intestinavium]|uniref:Biotin-dependent carboxyltransferase family protein n=1 Tax=Candidatus Avacidaminococcus intestinavium TaxID=2840684 RepID=A0A9D1SM02_9FIRM|nr:biotin-dependent carboxyltransferase family protein [Candidatus Avacidaminococcus intestinavium]